jgi:hypothetical protein
MLGIQIQAMRIRPHRSKQEVSHRNQWQHPQQVKLPQNLLKPRDLLQHPVNRRLVSIKGLRNLVSCGIAPQRGLVRWLSCGACASDARVWSRSSMKLYFLSHNVSKAFKHSKNAIFTHQIGL